MWYSNSRPQRYILLLRGNVVKCHTHTYRNHAYLQNYGELLSWSLFFNYAWLDNIKELYALEVFDFNSEMLTDLSSSLHFNPKKMLFGLPWQLYGHFF